MWVRYQLCDFGRCLLTSVTLSFLVCLRGIITLISMWRCMCQVQGRSETSYSVLCPSKDSLLFRPGGQPWAYLCPGPLAQDAPVRSLGTLWVRFSSYFPLPRCCLHPPLISRGYLSGFLLLFLSLSPSIVSFWAKALILRETFNPSLQCPATLSPPEYSHIRKWHLQGPPRLSSG